MSNATWTQALFDTMLDPKGIDYWWTDYGGCASPTPGQFALPATNGCPTAVQKTESTAVLLWSNMIYDSMIKTGRDISRIRVDVGHGRTFHTNNTASEEKLRLQLESKRNNPNVGQKSEKEVAMKNRKF